MLTRAETGVLVQSTQGRDNFQLPRCYFVPADSSLFPSPPTQPAAVWRLTCCPPSLCGHVNCFRIQIFAEKQNTSQEITVVKWAKPGCPALAWFIFFLKRLWVELMLPPGPSRRGTRLAVRNPRLTSWLLRCCCARMSTAMILHKQGLHLQAGLSAKVNTVCFFFTLPSLTMLREWIPPPRTHVPAHTWAERLRCPSVPSPKAEQSLSWGHLCSMRHISENVPDHRVPTMLCFCCTEPRAYRFPALKIH